MLSNNQVQVFSPIWFNVKRPKLLSLLNSKSSYVKDYFRYTMGIPKEYEQAIITEIHRDNFHVYNGHNQRIGVFYSGKPFSERLYNAYLPIWKAVHFFDMQFANRFMPELNLGFDTLTQYPQAGSGGTNTTCDGRILGYSSDYYDARSVGIDIYLDGLSVECSFNYSSYQIWRSFMTFNTASIGAGKNITAATLSLYANYAPWSQAPYSEPYSFVITKSTQALANNLALSDWTSYGSRIVTVDGLISTSAYTNIQFPTDDLNSAINALAISKFAMMFSNDYWPDPPTEERGMDTQWNSAESSYNKPKLVVTYSLAPTGQPQQQIL